MLPPDLRRRLLAWYDAHRRDLPWRSAPGQSADPYRVWLSEVMLQQTRVETVRPYFDRWLQRFPTVATLAEAPLDDVLKAWEGLGYYSRARNFHRAAGLVHQQHGGCVPGDPEAFRALPGVGRYTAGAVMSIAFGREEPVVDGNVRRVFARLMDDPDPADEMLWSMATDLVRGPRPGDVNQSVMELGATVCVPRNPRCGDCPVREFCGAFAAGTQTERPARKKGKPLPHEDTAVPVIERDGRVLLVRRPVAARLGGMWAFPAAIRAEGESVSAAAERAGREGLAIEIRAGAPVGVVEHTFTHVRATYHAIRCSLVDGDPRPLLYDEATWVTWARVADYALPVAQRRIAALADESTLFTPRA
ncbi:MAG TPA: A/G-specific adenine glycosylase [Longimicrobium sp.]|uniref:A/G-specific adenine glycosylase n=1 Tax=Longimicrobium sp. TaxID=2029185 RepID=UPI002EDB5842